MFFYLDVFLTAATAQNKRSISIIQQSIHHLQIIQSLFSSADIADPCCSGEAERSRTGEADDARDDDGDAERDLSLSLALSLVSLSDNIFARDFELVALSLQHKKTAASTPKTQYSLLSTETDFLSRFFWEYCKTCIFHIHISRVLKFHYLSVLLSPASKITKIM